MAIMAVAGFVLGLNFDKLFTKSYADERKTAGDAAGKFVQSLAGATEKVLSCVAYPCS